MNSNETRLTVEISDLIISEGLSLNLFHKYRFKKVLDLARTVSKISQPPNRKFIYKDLLGFIHDQNMKRNLSLIKQESDIFGLSFLSNGATISRIPLLNILVSGKNLLVAVLELVDCQGQLEDGGEKDVICICTRFTDNVRNTNPHKSIIHVVIFDGASNVHLAGKLLKIHCPKVSIMRGD